MTNQTQALSVRVAGKAPVIHKRSQFGSYQKSEFPSALAECEDDGLQSTRMPENI